MIKKQNGLLIFFIMAMIVLIPNVVNAAETLTAETVVNGETIKWNYNLNDSNQIVNLVCADKDKISGDVTIPFVIDEKNVIEIGSNAFSNATGLTGITIPNSVEKIGGKAFSKCTNLNKVNLGCIQNISFGAFSDCTSLKSIVIPKTLKSTGVSPIFSGCTNLKSIMFEEGLTIIPQYLCAKTPIESIVIPSTVEKIENSAFEDCVNLKSVDLSNVNAISFNAFKNCTSLASITIPKSIKNGAVSPIFTGCTNLKTIIFEEGTTVIPQYLCAKTPIESIVIPNTVEKIEYSAFEDCVNLKSVNLSNVHFISFNVFKNCKSLESITIPKTLKNGPVSPVFTGCTNLKTIIFEEGITIIPQYLCAGTPIENITIPNSVVKIEHSAFENCTNLKKITILDNCKDLGWSNSYPNEDTVFQNHNNDLTIYCYEGSEAASYAIRNNIKYVYLKRQQNEDNKQENDDDDTNKIPTGAKIYNGHSYYIFEQGMTWEEAKRFCESLGGYLATITSLGEQNFIKEYLADSKYNNQTFWLGATDAETEGVWKWITGEKFEYSNWGTGEPDNKFGGQDCLIIENRKVEGNTYTVERYQWDDISGSDKVWFICEWGQVKQETAGDTKIKTLQSIKIESKPSKTIYAVGEKFDSRGMKILAIYTDGTTAYVTGQCTYTPAGNLTKNDTIITISYTENGITKTAIQEIKIDSTKVTGTLPYTGGETAIIFIVIAIVGLGVYLYIKNKDLKGI